MAERAARAGEGRLKRSPQQLRDDALAIWQAGVDAVRSDRLVRDNVRIEDGLLWFADQCLELNEIQRIVVVGAGKAGAGMAQGLETALGPDVMEATQLSGWVNVPADCVGPLSRIHLHAARPAGLNEPTQAGVEGVQRILELVGQLDVRDLCICLLSGGGSALLPAPIPGITLADKQAITKHLSAAGANIEQLNTVRKQLSQVKGGGLARACKAGQLVTLIISDVLGDPLDVIASGPTVANTTTAEDALAVLEQFHAREAGITPSLFDRLRDLASAAHYPHPPPTATVSNHVIGNNAVAVDAAGMEAERRGYSHAMVAARKLESDADGIGRHLADVALRMRQGSEPDCLITGGEPTVQLVASNQRGLGGRNQQLVLASLQQLLDKAPPAAAVNPLEDMLILAGGTDGEDGPTDAAGAWIDAPAAAAAQQLGLVPASFLQRNDAYHFFQPLGTLLKTGPTHTNVCDVRVVLVNAMGE